MYASPAQLTDADSVRIEIRGELRNGSSLCQALREIDARPGRLEDGYPDWHPAPYQFEGMLKLFFYIKITGQSYRNLAENPELADAFGLKRIPDESILYRDWRQRFDTGVREFITNGAHYVVKEIHDLDLGVPAVRSKAGVVSHRGDPDDVVEDDPSEPFTDKKIARIRNAATHP